MKIHTVQLNLADLEAGTKDMDATEYGVYVRLFLACYETKDNDLPDDDARLARIARVSAHTWKKIRPIIEEKFKIFEKRWTHQRVIKDLERYKNLSERNRENRLKGLENKDADTKGNQPLVDDWSTSGQPSDNDSSTTGRLPNTQHLRTSKKEEVNATDLSLNPLKEKLPLTPGEKKEGVSKLGFEGEGKGRQWKVDDVMTQMDEKSMAKARSNAPGWDIYHLASVYVTGINDRTREAPRVTKAAFPEWCKSYTKGKRP